MKTRFPIPVDVPYMNGPFKITNPPALAGIIPKIIMKKLSILFVLMLVSVAGLFAQPGPVTVVPQYIISVATPTTIDVPVKVADFNTVGTFSLTLDYDPLVLVYTGVTPNPVLVPSLGGTGTFTPPPVSNTGQKSFGWFAPAPISSLPDSTILFTIHFNYLGGTSLLSWYDPVSAPEKCEYADGSGIPYTDTPTNDYYIDGWITDLAATATYTHQCDPGNAGVITIWATGGSGTYQYSIDGGVTWSLPPSAVTPYVFTGLAPGAYDVMVRDYAVSIPLASIYVSLLTIPVHNVTQDTYFCTIQAAVDNANAGDLIEASPWTYIEDITIPASKTGIHIKGLDKQTTIIKGIATEPLSNWPLATENIDIAANNVKISGFTIQSPTIPDGYYSSGIVLNGTGIEISGNDFVFDGTASHESRAVGIQTRRIDVEPLAAVGGLLIAQNTFSGEIGSRGYYGVFINRDNNTGTVTIEENTFSGRMRAGIASERNNVVIDYNVIDGQGVTWTGESINGIWIIDWDATRSINNITLTNNEIFDCAGTGIVLGYNDGTNAQVLTNVVVGGTGAGNTITGNDKGILVQSGANGVLINQNEISGNLTYGVENTSTVTVDATYNWWGDATGPYHNPTNTCGLANPVSDFVDFQPWYIDGTMTGTATLPIKNITQNTYYCEIQDAVNNAVDLDEIHFILPGNFGGLVFANPLNIIVKNASSGVVTMHGAGSALLVSAGHLSMQGVNLTTDQDDPTIVVSAGKLTLRDCNVYESTAYTQTGVLVTGGILDAGTSDTDPGHNRFLSDGTGLSMNNTGGTVDAICNHWGSDYYMVIFPKIAGNVPFDPWCNWDFTVCYLSRYNGPITYAPKKWATAGPVQIPVTVDRFANVDAISLTMLFDPSVLQFSNTFTPNALLGGMSVLADNTAGWVKIGWYNPPVAFLPDGDTVVLLDFNYLGGTSLLLWTDTNVTDCEYQNALIQYPYIDTPQANFYYDGWITDLDAISVSSTNVVCKGTQSGTITINGIGGSGVYEYTVDGGATWQSSNLFYVFAGTYHVMIRDKNFPFLVKDLIPALTIAEPATPLSATAHWTKKVRCKGESNGEATAYPVGGWGGYTYLWSDPSAQTTPVATGLAAGIYTVTITDVGGCAVVASCNVIEPVVAFTASAYESKVVSCKGGNDGEITVNAANGWGYYMFSIDNITYFNYLTTNVITGLPAGNYIVHIFDDEICEMFLPVTIHEPAVALSATAVESKTVTCFGFADGEITASATGGWGTTYEYSIDAGATWQTSPIFPGLLAGVYTIHVKDTQGCIVIAPVTVTQPTQLTGMISGNASICPGGSTQIQIDVSGGITPWNVTYTDGTNNFSLSNISTSPIILTVSPTIPTTWSLVSVTDFNNCSGIISGSATINFNPLPVVTAADLQTSTDLTNWSSVGGDITNGYVMCVDPLINYHYLDLNTLTLANVPLATTGFTQNAFTLKTTGLPANFYTYWANKGVVSGASGWQGVMWSIINGNAPMFYIGYDGTDYTLIDGLQYQYGSAVNPLRISGDYPQGLYTFEGTVLDQNGCTSDTFDISIQLNSSPVVTDVTLLETYDMTTWTPVSGTFTGGYEMCLDALAGYVYLDINTLTAGVNPLKTNAFVQNPFFLETTNLPAGFYSYWAAKGVVSGATGWEGIMWQIIIGSAPMFYVNYDGSDYTLVDGLQYLYASVVNPLRISGDYPLGDYTFTGVVTDVNECVSSSFSITMKLNQKPMISFGFNGVEAGHNATFDYCYNETVEVKLHQIYGGIAPFSVTYEVNGVTSTVTGLNIGGVISAAQLYTPGLYNIVVTDITDDNGCHASPTFLAFCQATMIIHPMPEIALTDPSPKACVGAMSVDFPFNSTTNGPDHYSITWSAGALLNGFTDVTNVPFTTSPIVVTMSGTAAQGAYTGQLVVINSITGCVSTPYTITVNVPTPVAAYPYEVPVTCYGSNDGMAYANASGGWGNYSYLWNDPAAQTTDPATGLVAGTYQVTITDGAGCTATASVTVTEPGKLNATVNKTDVTCYGLADGTITISNPTGGHGTFEYRLDNGNWQQSPVFTGLGTGTYTVEIRDAAYVSCTVVLGSQTIIEPQPNIISGYYTYYNPSNTILNNITVYLRQGVDTLYTTVTDINGYYSFPSVCPGTYEVISTTVKPIGSINATDAVQVNVWGTSGPNHPPIEKVLFKAGDVVAINVINSFDAARILNHFVTAGNPPFSVNPWAFWKANDLIAVNNFTDGPYPTITVANTSLTQDFYGLVSGDFNRSFIPGSAKSGGSVVLNHSTSMPVDGQHEFFLPITAGISMDVTAASLIMNYPADKIEVVGVCLGNDLNSQVLFNAENGELRIGWNALIPMILSNGDAFFTLKLKALPAFTSGENATFTLTIDPLNELAGDDFQVITHAILNIASLESTVGTPELPGGVLITFSNYPNPFNHNTTFTYTLPSDGHVSMEIYDLAGRKVDVPVNRVQTAGSYTFTMDNTLLRTGVYTASLKLHTPEGILSRTIKIVSHK